MREMGQSWAEKWHLVTIPPLSFQPQNKVPPHRGKRRSSDARRKHVNEHLSSPKTCKLGRKGNRNGIYYASAQRAPQLLTDHLPWKESVCKWIWIDPTNCPILCKQMAIIRRRKFVDEQAGGRGRFKESTLSVEGRKCLFVNKNNKLWVFVMPWTELQLTRLAKDSDIEVEPRMKEEKKSDGQEFRFCHLTGGWSNTGATPNTIQRNRRSATKYSQDTKYWDRGAQIYRQLLSWSGRYIVCQKRSMSLVLDEQIFRPSVVLKNPTLALQQHIGKFLKLAFFYLLGLLTTLQSSQ